MKPMRLETDHPDNIDNDEDSLLTLEALRGVMPKSKKHNVDQGLVDQLNSLISDPEARRNFRHNLMGYTSVLQDSTVSFQTYVHAVRYVSYKLMGYSNQDSWIKTFPKRYERLLKDGKNAMFIRSTVACYNRNKTVNTILEQTLVPSYVLNQDMYQQALNVQLGLMMNAKSEKVRTDAANSLLVHLKQPDSTKVHIDVRVKEDDSIKELREVTLELVKQQRLMIQSGAMNARDVAESKIISGDFERVE